MTDSLAPSITPWLIWSYATTANDEDLSTVMAIAVGGGVDRDNDFLDAIYTGFLAGQVAARKPPRCGGCAGLGSHRKHCRANPDYSWARELADEAEHLGDTIGANNCGAANACYRAAGLLLERTS